MNQEIIGYIKQCREARMTDDVIRGELLKVGWQESDINLYLQSKGLPVGSSLNSSQEASVERKKITGRLIAKMPLAISVALFFCSAALLKLSYHHYMEDGVSSAPGNFFYGLLTLGLGIILSFLIYFYKRRFLLSLFVFLYSLLAPMKAVIFETWFLGSVFYAIPIVLLIVLISMYARDKRDERYRSIQVKYGYDIVLVILFIAFTNIPHLGKISYNLYVSNKINKEITVLYYERLPEIQGIEKHNPETRASRSGVWHDLPHEKNEINNAIDLYRSAIINSKEWQLLEEKKGDPVYKGIYKKNNKDIWIFVEVRIDHYSDDINEERSKGHFSILGYNSYPDKKIVD